MRRQFRGRLSSVKFLGGEEPSESTSSPSRCNERKTNPIVYKEPKKASKVVRNRFPFRQLNSVEITEKRYGSDYQEEEPVRPPPKRAEKSSCCKKNKKKDKQVHNFLTKKTARKVSHPLAGAAIGSLFVGNHKPYFLQRKPRKMGSHHADQIGCRRQSGTKKGRFH